MVLKEKVDINNWKRKEQYLFFKKYQNPYLSITSILNVDNIVNYSKVNKVSFYGLLMFLCLKTINEINEFKYSIEDDGVYKYEKINATFSVIDINNNLNFSRTVGFNNFNNFMKDFLKAKNDAENHVNSYQKNELNKCYFTCMPWIRITSFTNPIFKIDSITRICWGKYFIDNGQYLIDLSIQVNHALMDGYHIGLFYNTLQENINKFNEVIKNDNVH